MNRRDTETAYVMVLSFILGFVGMAILTDLFGRLI